MIGKDISSYDIEETAQALYEQDGHGGSLYRQSAEMLIKYENKAIEVLDKENHASKT